MKLTFFEKDIIQVFSKHYGRSEVELIKAYQKMGNTIEALRITLDMADTGIEWWFLVKQIEKGIKTKKVNFNPLNN